MTDRSGERMELLMKVEGMTCQGCVAAVTKAVQRLDPAARVSVDLEAGRVAIVTDAQASTWPRRWAAPGTRRKP